VGVGVGGGEWGCEGADGREGEGIEGVGTADEGGGEEEVEGEAG
jgi:hypothetical protein